MTDPIERTLASLHRRGVDVTLTRVDTDEATVAALKVEKDGEKAAFGITMTGGLIRVMILPTEGDGSGEP